MGALSRTLAGLALLVLAAAPSAGAQDIEEALAVALAFQSAYEVDDYETAAEYLSEDARAALLAAPALVQEVDPFTALMFDDRQSVAAVFAVLDGMVYGEEEAGEAAIAAELEDGLQMRVLGHVAPSEDSVYVLVGSRLTFYNEVMEAVIPVTTTWDGERWGTAVPFEIETMLALFRAYAADPEAMGALFAPELYEEPLVLPTDPKKRQ